MTRTDKNFKRKLQQKNEEQPRKMKESYCDKNELVTDKLAVR